MELFQVMVQREADYDTLAELLDLDILHYVDLNEHVPPTKLMYIDSIKRIEETNKSIKFIEQIYKAYQVPLKAPEDASRQVRAIDEVLK